VNEGGLRDEEGKEQPPDGPQRPVLPGDGQQAPAGPPGVFELRYLIDKRLILSSRDRNPPFRPGSAIRFERVGVPLRIVQEVRLLDSPHSRSFCGASLYPSVLLCLDGMRVDDRPEQPREASLNLRATRCVEHLDASAFTSDQSGFAQKFEVLREGRFGNLPIAYRQKGGAVLVAALHNVGEDGRAHGIGERMENRPDRNLFSGGMDERPHVPQF
jgi:hypothetical protein